MATTVENPFDTQQSSTSGIVNTAMTGAGSKIAGTDIAAPTVAQYTPETRSIDKTTQTVAGQVDSILAKDSPLMQRARTLATQGMAQRGLVNSSMAQGAGTAAMIDKATPIASQDAATYNSVASENMAAKNNAGQFNAAAQNQFGLQGAQQQFDNSQAEKNRSFTTLERLGSQDFAAAQTKAQQDFTAAQAVLERAQQTAMADKSIKAQSDLQIAQQNFTSAQAALDRTQQTAIQKNQLDFQTNQAAMDRSQQTALQNDQQEFATAEGKANRQVQVDMQQVAIKAQNAQIPATFAQNITNTAMSGVNAILADGNLTAAAKQTAISNLVTYANSQIDWANKFYGTSITAITAPKVA